MIFYSLKITLERLAFGPYDKKCIWCHLVVVLWGTWSWPWQCHTGLDRTMGSTRSIPHQLVLRQRFTQVSLIFRRQRKCSLFDQGCQEFQSWRLIPWKQPKIFCHKWPKAVEIGFCQNSTTLGTTYGNLGALTWGRQWLVPDGRAPEPGLLEDLGIVGGDQWASLHAHELHVWVAQVVGPAEVVGVLVSVEREGGLIPVFDL